MTLIVLCIFGLVAAGLFWLLTPLLDILVQLFVETLSLSLKFSFFLLLLLGLLVVCQFLSRLGV